MFDQALSAEDLDAASGGIDEEYRERARTENCSSSETRLIYGEKGFPKCAATVVEDSFGGSNDACYITAVKYIDVGHWDDVAYGGKCAKAWR